MTYDSVVICGLWKVAEECAWLLRDMLARCATLVCPRFSNAEFLRVNYAMLCPPSHFLILFLLCVIYFDLAWAISEYLNILSKAVMHRFCGATRLEGLRKPGERSSCSVRKEPRLAGFRCFI